MATVRVDFEVQPSAGIQAYWIAVGNEDIPLTNGKGSIMLAQGATHTLVWWFVGNSGEKISILGKQQGHSIVNVKESKIPSEELEGAGVKRFITI